MKLPLKNIVCVCVCVCARACVSASPFSSSLRHLQSDDVLRHSSAPKVFLLEILSLSLLPFWATTMMGAHLSSAFIGCIMQPSFLNTPSDFFP